MKNRPGKLEHRFSQKIQTKFNIFFFSFVICAKFVITIQISKQLL